MTGESSSFDIEKSGSTAAEETKEEDHNKSGGIQNKIIYRFIDCSMLKSNGSDDGNGTHHERESSLSRDSQSFRSSSSQSSYELHNQIDRLKKKRRTMTDDTRKVEATTASQFYAEQQRRKSITDRNDSPDNFTDLFRKDSQNYGSQDELNTSGISNTIDTITNSVMNEKERPKSLFRMADNIVNQPKEIHYHDSKDFEDVF